MSIFNVLSLLCGLALFLFGMNVMSEGLKKSAGNRLKVILTKMTSNPWKGFLLGLLVTVIVQSSSATTVMVVGFVNSGTLSLSQSVGVTFGAEIGAAITNWLTGLAELGGAESITGFTDWLTPDAWMPVLALIGVVLFMFSHRSRYKDIGSILMGFSVLMVGMSMMSGAVAGLKESELFRNVLTMFNNPLLGVLAGIVITAIIQSSSASIGILQTLSTTGAVTWGMAIPIVMGQNIGTCITALLASVGASRNAKRAAFVHLYFNVIGTIFCLSAFAIVTNLVTIPLMSQPIGMLMIALVNTVFKLVSALLLMPFTRQIEKLTKLTIRDGALEKDVNPLDERLFNTPAVAVESAEEVTYKMAKLSIDAILTSMDVLENYDAKIAADVREAEAHADVLEDELGSYLVKLSGHSAMEKDSYEITKLLRLIGDFERISDHAVNLVESAEEMRDKKIVFSDEADHELKTLSSALREILALSLQAFLENNVSVALRVEPLEEVIDDLRDQIKINHIRRLQKSACTIEHGFVLSDILTNLERVADHCSNIAGCVVEIARNDALDMHRYQDEVKHNDADFERLYEDYHKKYAL